MRFKKLLFLLGEEKAGILHLCKQKILRNLWLGNSKKDENWVFFVEL
jgi:hypothetical protein